MRFLHHYAYEFIWILEWQYFQVVDSFFPGISVVSTISWTIGWIVKFELKVII